MNYNHALFAALRIGMGWIFMWSFLDKLFGLGYGTCRDAASGSVQIMCEKAWLSGGSPTGGFLKFGTSGPFAELFQSIAGSGVVDWLYMAGMLGIGAGLMLGIAMRVAVWSGIAMMVLIYAASYPPEHNPIMSEHIIYIIILLLFLMMPVGRWWGLEKRR